MEVRRQWGGRQMMELWETGWGRQGTWKSKKEMQHKTKQMKTKLLGNHKKLGFFHGRANLRKTSEVGHLYLKAAAANG